MVQSLVIPDFLTATIGFAVFVLGAMLNARVGLLQRLNIPGPGSGGLLAGVGRASGRGGGLGGG